MREYESSMRKWLIMTKEEIFSKFSEFGGAKCIDRGDEDERFLYIPGTRMDRVVLIAHADSVWDANRKPIKVRFDEKELKFSSADKEIGIGADDHAGCAMLWELRNLGHSLLITSGEEKHQIASRWITTDNQDISEELNSHNFMVQFDRRNALDFKCYDVGTDNFREYIGKEMPEYKEPDRFSTTDIKVLCEKIPGVNSICGVNFSIGYYREHEPEEYLLMNEWENTLKMAKKWLKQENLPKFSH